MITKKNKIDSFTVSKSELGTLHVDPGVDLTLENVQFHAPNRFAISSRAARINMRKCVIKDSYAIIWAMEETKLSLVDCDIIAVMGDMEQKRS